MEGGTVTWRGGCQGREEEGGPQGRGEAGPQ